MEPIHVRSVEEFIQCLNDPQYNTTVVDFSATWCGPCQDMKPIFLEHSKNFITIQFLEVDVDELEEVASSANIRAMPTFKVYQNGEEVEELVGASKDGLLEMIQKYA